MQAIQDGVAIDEKVYCKCLSTAIYRDRGSIVQDFTSFSSLHTLFLEKKKNVKTLVHICVRKHGKCFSGACKMRNLPKLEKFE